MKIRLTKGFIHEYILITLAQIIGQWVYDFSLGSKLSKRCLCDTVPKNVAYLISFQTKTVSEFNWQ